MKKIIGVCMTQAHAEFSREFLKTLYKFSLTNNAKLFVFNSVYDFAEKKNKGARSVYYGIPYDKLSALIILHETIFDSTLVDRIIRDAKEHNVPVIMARKYDPRCISVIGEYEDVYTDMLTKIIKDRDLKDIVYIAGKNVPDVDYDSKIRIHCFKNALENVGIPFDQNNLLFGGFWEKPVIEVVNKLLDMRDKVPDAIFCGNDIMAQSVMNVLINRGIKVPEDVVVTGFDGLEAFRYSSPALTSCVENLDDLCSTVFEVIGRLEDDSIPTTHYYNYEAVFSESCGYEATKPKDLNADITKLFGLSRVNYTTEFWSGVWLESLLLKKGHLEDFYESLQTYVTKDYNVALCPIEVARVINPQYHVLDEKMNLYYLNRSTREMEHKDFVSSSLVPDFEDWINDDSVCIETALFADRNCYGVTFEKGTDIDELCYLVNRHAQTLNNALLACLIKEI